MGCGGSKPKFGEEARASKGYKGKGSKEVNLKSLLTCNFEKPVHKDAKMRARL